MILRVHLRFYTCILLACTLFKLYDYCNKYDGPRSLATWKEALAVDVRPCRPSLKYLQCFISASYRVSVCESVFKSAV